ncbi:hypothetical protein GF420_08485, partial [candidate division GN15 bacterium]|nr:hypothetical protein [candidate division GN15 bacterium]
MSISEPLQEIQLSRSALRQNVTSLKRLAGERMMAVSVKANAYGHGLPEFVSMLIDMPEVDHLAVHSLDEAIACRGIGWPRRVMVLGPIAVDSVDAVFEYDLE